MEQKIVYTYDCASEHVKEEDICLNNFAPSPFKADDDFLYPTVEHYYQCHKFDNFSQEDLSDELKSKFKAAYEDVRRQPDPLHTKKAARKYEDEFQNEWQKDRWHSGYKVEIMKKALILKFRQNEKLLEHLLSTGNARIVEYSLKDPYWGGVLEGSHNMLGNLLGEIRDNYIKDNKLHMEGIPEDF